jgi:virulence-associated protein VagC
MQLTQIRTRRPIGERSIGAQRTDETYVDARQRCRLEGEEVYVEKIGDVVMLVPKDSDMLSTMLEATGKFTDDFMSDIEDLPLQEGEPVEGLFPEEHQL